MYFQFNKHVKRWEKWFLSSIKMNSFCFLPERDEKITLLNKRNSHYRKRKCYYTKTVNSIYKVDFDKSHAVSSPAQRSACPTSCWRSRTVVPELTWSQKSQKPSFNTVLTVLPRLLWHHGRLRYCHSFLSSCQNGWQVFLLTVSWCLFVSAFPASLLFMAGKNPQSAYTALICQLQATLRSDLSHCWIAAVISFLCSSPSFFALSHFAALSYQFLPVCTSSFAWLECVFLSHSGTAPT